MTKYIDSLHRKANIRFGITALIAVLGGIFIIWPNFQQYQKTRAGIAESNAQIADSELQLETERGEYRALKAEYNLQADNDQKTVMAILPQRAEETAIVRELENKANEISGSDNSLKLESVDIGKPKDIKDVDYLSLPINIKISGTKEKLMAFIRYLEKTGNTLDNAKKATRLIDTEDIKLQLKDRGAETLSADETTMDINATAYILPSAEEITANQKK